MYIVGEEEVGEWNVFLSPSFPVLLYTLPCWKSNPNFRDITWNVEENLLLQELFHVVSRFPRYISYYIYHGKSIIFGTVIPCSLFTVGRLIPWSWASPIAHRHRNYLVDYTCVPLRPICPRSRAATFAPLRHAASLHFHQFSRQPNVFFWDRANEYPGRVFATNLAQSWFWCEAKRWCIPTLTHCNCTDEPN